MALNVLLAKLVLLGHVPMRLITSAILGMGFALPINGVNWRAVARVIERFVVSPPMAPDAPDAFRFAGPGKLRGVLAEAGAVSPSERVLQFTIQVP